MEKIAVNIGELMQMRLFILGIVYLASMPVFVSNLHGEEAKSPLVEFEIVDQIEIKSIPESLTGVAGNVARGEATMINRKKGNCLACHKVGVFDEKAKTDPNRYGDMGEVGPHLDGVASRYDVGQLRLLLVDAKVIFPETMMPSFYRVKNFERVLPEFENKPILSAQDIEDVLSFLLTLK